MKEEFRSKKFKDESLLRIKQCNDVIDDYLGQGLRLTLRQLYYVLVTQNVIPNSVESYKALGSLVSDARLAGMMDWDAIEDRGRRPTIQLEFRDLQHRIDLTIANYRLERWKGQNNYVELWVEKDALAGVLAPLAEEHHVTMMVNKGYSSQSALYSSSKRFLEASDEGKDLILFYLGDHDPSGEDMVRDIQTRLGMFGAELEVRKLALTMSQIKQYKPPPNPTKLTDSRAAAYVEKFGNSSWEVDALPPQRLAQIIRDEFEDVIDMELMDEIKEQEEQDKKELLKAVAQIMKKK